MNLTLHRCISNGVSRHPEYCQTTDPFLLLETAFIRFNVYM